MTTPNPTPKESLTVQTPDKSEEPLTRYTFHDGWGTEEDKVGERVKHEDAQQRIAALQGELEKWKNACIKLGSVANNSVGLVMNNIRSVDVAELQDLQSQLTAATKERDEARASCAAMRQTLLQEKSDLIDCIKNLAAQGTFDEGLEEMLGNVKKALSTDCGKEILEELERLRKSHAEFYDDTVESQTIIEDLEKRLRLAEAVIKSAGEFGSYAKACQHTNTGIYMVGFWEKFQPFEEAYDAFMAHARDGVQSPEVPTNLPTTVPAEDHPLRGSEDKGGVK